MEKILIVDDENDIAELISDILEDEGYETVIANDGKTAINLVREENFDLILLDVMMPDISGTEVCASIRNETSCPIIFVTAKTNLTSKLVGFEVGADDYITKPYNPTILLLRINALLKRAAASSANNSTFYREMEILPQKGVIKYNDGRDEMLLTKNEMTIFMCLLAKKDRIVSRDELMTELWNNEEYLNDNALTVNISRLRARFKDIGIEDVIETRKGQGYILV